jgi:hypothetical protein
MPALLGLIASAATALVTGACVAPTDPGPGEDPVYVFFTGNVYEQGGSGTDLEFNLQADTLTSPTLSGGFSVGVDTGEFTVQMPGEAAEPAVYTMDGTTSHCTNVLSSGACSSSSTAWQRALNIGLQITADSIEGATPTGDDPLVWQIARSMADGTETFTGSIITAGGGSVPVSVEIDTEGTVYGQITFRGRTLVMNGYTSLDGAPDLGNVPQGAIVALLLTSALHVGSY